MTCYSITHSRKIPTASYKSRGNPSAIKLECWIFAQIQWRACLRLGSQSHNVNALYLYIYREKLYSLSQNATSPLFFLAVRFELKVDAKSNTTYGWAGKTETNKLIKY